MGFFFLASLFAAGISYALTDWISDDGEDDETSQPDSTPEPQRDTDEGSDTSEPDADPAPEGDGDEPVQGEMFAVANSPDDPTEGTEGNDLIRVLSGAAEFDAGDGDDVFSVQTLYNDVPEGQIGAVLTGGEGADSYTFHTDNFPQTTYAGEFATTVEITDFDPEEDRLVLPDEAFYGFKPVGDPEDGLFEKTALEELSIEPSEDGSYTDVVLKADLGGEELGETLRIRLWGQEDFDPTLIQRGEATVDGTTGEASITTETIQFSAGTEILTLDNSLVLGTSASEGFLLFDPDEGSKDSVIMAGAGDDAIFGSETDLSENVKAYGGSDDDTIDVYGHDLDIFGGEDDDMLTGWNDGAGYLNLSGDDGDDYLAHRDGDHGMATLDGGDGDDTLAGQSGDQFIDGEHNYISIDAPLDPGADHNTLIIAPEGELGADVAVLHFPTGTDGVLHILKTHSTQTGDEGTSTAGGAKVYYIADGESFDPNDPSNSTLVSEIELPTLKEHDGDYPFPDFDNNIVRSNVTIAGIHDPV